MERDAVDNRVHVICPRLHHLLALGQEGRFVIGRANLIALAMRELAFNVVRPISQLVEHRGGCPAKTMG